MKGRSRLLHYEFFMNEELAELGAHGQLLFAGLWTIADKKGRLELRPKKIKAMLFPYYEINIKKLLEDLDRLGLITIYGQGSYIQVVNWDEYQRPHNQEKASELPSQQELALNPTLKPEESKFQLNRIRNKNRNKNSIEVQKIKKEQIEDFVNSYNRICGEKLPRVLKITSSRHKIFRECLITESRIEKWEFIFAYAITIPFLTGNNDRGWSADLEFIAKNYYKILEGKYSNGVKPDHDFSGGII